MESRRDIKTAKMLAQTLVEALNDRPAKTAYTLNLAFQLSPYRKLNKKQAQKKVKDFIKALSAFEDLELLENIVMSATQDVGDFNSKLVADVQQAAMKKLTKGKQEPVKRPAPLKRGKRKGRR